MFGERPNGFDIHQTYTVVAAVDGEQHVHLEPTTVSMDRLADGATQHLSVDDVAVLEAGTNAWYVTDLLCNHVDRVVVANPYKTKLIVEARIKNDKLDVCVLAQLLAANLICDVWVPSAQIREQRTLSAHRVALREQGTQVKNQLHNMCHRRSQKCPVQSLFSPAGRQWLCNLPWPQTDRMRVRHLLQQLDLIQA